MVGRSSLQGGAVFSEFFSHNMDWGSTYVSITWDITSKAFVRAQRPTIQCQQPYNKRRKERNVTVDVRRYSRHDASATVAQSKCIQG